jgi:hypothetical protein
MGSSATTMSASFISGISEGMYPFRGQRGVYVQFTKSLLKSAEIRVSHFFSMLPSTLKYLYSVEPVRMYFPTKQLCTNDTVCYAALHTVSFVHGCFAGKCILTGSTE